MVDSHENCTIPRQRGPEGSELKTLFDHYLGLGDEILHKEDKNSKIGNANFKKKRYDTEGS